MADVDFSNPVAVIVGFFALLFTALIMLVRVLQAFFIGGILGAGALTLLFGFVWFENFNKK